MDYNLASPRNYTSSKPNQKTAVEVQVHFLRHTECEHAIAAQRLENINKISNYCFWWNWSWQATIEKSCSSLLAAATCWIVQASIVQHPAPRSRIRPEVPSRLVVSFETLLNSSINTTQGKLPWTGPLCCHYMNTEISTTAMANRAY